MPADFLDTSLAKALSHPLRLQILETLGLRGEGSPRRLAEELGERLPNVSYHVRILHELGFIELTRTAQRRGAIEHFYRPILVPAVGDSEWEELPVSVRRSLAGGTASRIVHSLATAAGRGGFDRADAHVTWMPMSLDDEGRNAVAALLVDVVAQLTRVQEESNKRSDAGGDEPAPSEVALLHLTGGPA
jgi:DNA-binding transcriptional ArsR family regulator